MERKEEEKVGNCLIIVKKKKILFILRMIEEFVKSSRRGTRGNENEVRRFLFFFLIRDIKVLIVVVDRKVFF